MIPGMDSDFLEVNSCMGHLKRSGWEPPGSTLLCGHEEWKSDGKEPSPSPAGGCSSRLTELVGGFNYPFEKY